MKKIEIVIDEGAAATGLYLLSASVGFSAIIGGKAQLPDTLYAVHPLQLPTSPVLQHSNTPALQGAQ